MKTKKMTIKRADINTDKILNDKNGWVEDDFLVCDKKLFGDDEEHDLELHFADGQAITTDGKYYLKYPTLKEVADDEDLEYNIYIYCFGDYDGLPLTYRNVAMYCADVYEIID